MPRSHLDAQLRSRIDSFVQEINAIVREAAVDAVQEALSNGAPLRRSSRKATGKKTPKKRGGKRIRRSGAQVKALASKAQVAIRREPGRRLGEIAKELGLATKDVRRPVQMLLDARAVRTTGQRGGTRYFPASAGRKKVTKKKRSKKSAKRKRAAA